MNDRMDGRKVLVTQAEDYMGPAIAELFEAEASTWHAVENKAVS